MAGTNGLVNLQLYRLLVEQAADYALFILDTDGRVMTWNLGAQRIKGYAAEEIIGRHFSVFYTREALASGWPAHELKVALAEGRFEDEGWRVRKDGSRFWANVVITALRDENGRLLGYSKIMRDLTQRKLHEQALRQTEERFRVLVEGVVDYAIFMLDPQGIVTSWNTGAERIKGYPREEVIGKHVSRFYLPEDVEAGKPWEELAAARREGRAETEGWRVRKDGSRFWARAVLTALYDDAEHLRGFAKITHDLTERRNLRELEKAAQNMNEFIATLAHELRNPLAPIRTALEIMARAPAGDPAHAAMRQTIDRQSAQLVRIVEDLVDIARITRGLLAVQHRPMDLAEAVRRALETAAPLIEAARHALQVELPPRPIHVQGDVDRLAQLLTNVLNNAARYTPAGGRIALAARVEAGRALVEVRDTGRGIEQDSLARIFDMFVQGHSPAARARAGLGVGLALARRIAELHGGTLEAESEGPGKGSVFTLRLPLAAELAEETRPARAVHSAAAARQRILVVDDNRDAAATLEMVLKSSGHETRVAYDGAEALAIAPQFQPDIVLLDIGMPGLDGYQVAARLRALDPPRAMRIIAMTGWGTQSERQKSKEAGFDLHLVKPVEPGELLQIIDSAA